VAIERLLEIMRRLRDPEQGCPWDREQTWQSIAPHTIEEAYELEDAIRKGDATHVKDELGDLLFQVVCQARIAEEAGAFAFDDVVETICDKLERRHPHVFGEKRADSAAQVSVAWEALKARERAARGGGGVLDGVVVGLPALTRAGKLGQRAARVGFDWSGPQGVFEKLCEELAELDAALAARRGTQAGEELGDLLFTAAQLARHLGVDPEACLRSANRKFEERFGSVELALKAENRTAADATPAELERLWEQAKRQPG
jgi:MazG family protein